MQAVDLAFPDLNCDRAEGGRWRPVREELEVIIASGLTRSGRPEELSRWRGVVNALDSLHGLRSWLKPAIGEGWIRGDWETVTKLRNNASLRLSCPLGVAAVAVASFIAHVADVRMEMFQKGKNMDDLADEFGPALFLGMKGPALLAQLALQQALVGVRFLLPVLAAVRWPIIDLLSAVERHTLRPIHEMLVELETGRPAIDCLATYDPQWRSWLDLVRRMAEDDEMSASGNVAYRNLPESERLVHFTDSLPAEAPGIFYECTPLALLHDVVRGLVCSEQQHMGHEEDPEMCFENHDWNARDLVWKFNWDEVFLTMNFGRYPALSLWRRLRQLVFHRLELPFGSTAELAAALGLRPPHVLFRTDSEHGGSPVRFKRAYAAFKLLGDMVGSETPSRSSVALLTACWGSGHARQLPLWLAAARRADMLTRTLAMCHDDAALEACRSAHLRPQLCADARDWPRSLLSKLAGIALALAAGADALWLDMDAVLLRHPVPFLKAWRPKTEEDAGKHNSQQKPEMLFSVEATSWNCINAGVFLMRATDRVRRYLAHWISLYLQRPHSLDQSALFLLLNLISGMDWAAFAKTEGLFRTATNPRRVRAAALGDLVTPTWGALEPQARFGMTGMVATGGIRRGRAEDLVVFHLLNSFPKHQVLDNIYRDVDNDTLGAILGGLDGTPDDVERAWELIRRSENEGFREERLRDCHQLRSHGR